jgi:hypothetical protein
LREIQSAQNLKKVKILYTIVPPSKPDIVIGDNLEIMCYKGQRKLRTSICPSRLKVDGENGIKSIIDEWDEFFKIRSVPVEPEFATDTIRHISGDEFRLQVLESSSLENPILVQMYEKSCFLCFLMRPFVNQLSRILTGVVPFTIKRLDIEENDFPDGCPVVRGTPTFILFRGPDREPIRYEEFKPRDLVRRICLDYTIPDEVAKKLNDLVDKVGLRFQLFSGLIMWNTESEKVLELISSSMAEGHATIPFDLATAEVKDKEMFNKYVSELMSEDMLKVDELDQNIVDLGKELNSAEMHAIMMGRVLGEKVLKKERTAETSIDTFEDSVM